MAYLGILNGGVLAGARKHSSQLPGAIGSLVARPSAQELGVKNPSVRAIFALF